MPWFIHHQGILYWMATAFGILAMDPRTWRERHRIEKRNLLVTVGLLATVGIYVSIRPFLPEMQNTSAAYFWSIASLIPLIALSLSRSSDVSESNSSTPSEPPRDVAGSVSTDDKSFPYSSGLLVALIVSAVYVLGARIQVYKESGALQLHSQAFQLAFWSLISHLALAMAVLSVLNLIYFLASKSSKPNTIRRWAVGTTIVVALWLVLLRFLDDAMSFDGRMASAYAFSLALTLIFWGSWVARPFMAQPVRNIASRAKVFAWALVALLIGLALMSRSLIGGEDWNGFVGSTWALIFWAAMSLCIYRLRPARTNYSLTVILGTFLVTAFIYKGLQWTEIFWGKPLGSTDDEISLTLEDYGSRDASFQLAHHVLGNGRHENCGDLCRILREYTNIRDTHIGRGVRLVENLSPTGGQRPNIFIFVIDSMRADYLGAYNPSVDYTPNLDALARDSVVFSRTYTEYAGTTISEPAIWAGAQLLHTHFPQPFDQVNSLRTLARTDDYDIVASFDTVLKQLFTPNDALIKLDTQKQLWNQYEACSTVSQLETYLDSRAKNSQPVLFYAQPMNVHQFARNDVPSPASQHWPDRPGLHTRLTYEVHWVDGCLGGFFSYLKKRGMYDDSIIIVTSDHGDATGELGRNSHSTSIWPEIMRVPLIVHLPATMRRELVYDDTRLSTLTDIAPTLYYILGHRPIRQHELYGRPLLAETKRELDAYPQRDLLLASDVRAVYGILTADGKYLYTTYDSPAQSYLFDLVADPNAQHNILSPALKQRYDEEIIEDLQKIGDYYGYKPGVGSLLASATH
jgi:hypothetical protein